MIERFFNPVINEIDFTLYLKSDAIKYCIDYYEYIRHYSFKGDEYIKYDGKNLIWNCGSEVNIDELPNDKGWGKYFSETHNLCSF